MKRHVGEKCPFLLAAILFVTSILPASLAHADGVCQLGDTREDCRKRIEEQFAAATADTREVTESKTADAAAASAAAGTGTSNASTSLPTSSFTDFFNTLKVAANTGEGGEEDPESLAFEFNRCGLGARPGSLFQCQLRARIEQPEVNGALKTALEEAELTENLEEIEDGLDVGDKITAGVFVSLVNGYFGREAGTIHNELFQALQDEAELVDGGATPAARAELEAALQENTEHLSDLIRTRIAPAPAGATEPTPEQLQAAQQIFAPTFTFGEFPADLRDAELQNYEELFGKALAYTAARAQALKATHYFDLANLVNNQPQLLFGVEYASTSEFAGPDEFRAKVSLESGLINVNGFRRHQRRVCSSRPDLKGSVAICLGNYLEAQGGTRALEASARLAATIEYVKRKKYAVSISDTTIAVNAPAFRSLIGTLVYGRYIPTPGADDQKVRIDISASYEDVSDDPQRQDRGLASATLSRQLTADWLLSLGLIYATKPEFRAEADKDLSLRLGFNYRILRKPGT